MAHVLHLHPREPAARDPVYRGDQFSFETDGATSQRRGLVVCQNLRCLPAGSCRGERADEAIAREKQLKRWKRDWKIELIERDNLEWRDLSDLLV